MIALTTLPAVAAPDNVHTFAIPGVHGISAWGNYLRTGPTVRITVCVKDTAHDVYGGAAAGVAYDARHHQAVTAITIGYGHTGCQTMTSRYTAHLVVDTLSGWRDGKVRQAGPARQVY
ncbi:MAG: hypothetical protein JO345_35225 [Streptosporangiaceae bacterium]|nr:hypothetical protein [Streptosporangiaceae bacterium]